MLSAFTWLPTIILLSMTRKRQVKKIVFQYGLKISTIIYSEMIVNYLVEGINHLNLICQISFLRQLHRSSKQKCNFSKMLEKLFLNISLHFLVDAKPFHLICKLLLYYQNFCSMIVEIISYIRPKSIKYANIIIVCREL